MLHKIIHDLSIYYEFIATHLWIDKIIINENIIQVKPSYEHTEDSNLGRVQEEAV